MQFAVSVHSGMYQDGRAPQDPVFQKAEILSQPFQPSFEWQEFERPILASIEEDPRGHPTWTTMTEVSEETTTT